MGKTLSFIAAIVLAIAAIAIFNPATLPQWIVMGLLITFARWGLADIGEEFDQWPR